MKAILEFMLPDEAHEHLVALNGVHYLSALRDADAYIRNILKYQTGRHVDLRKELQAVRTLIRELVPGLDDDL